MFIVQIGRTELKSVWFVFWTVLLKVNILSFNLLAILFFLAFQSLSADILDSMVQIVQFMLQREYVKVKLAEKKINNV